MLDRSIDRTNEDNYSDRSSPVFQFKDLLFASFSSIVRYRRRPGRSTFSCSRQRFDDAYRVISVHETRQNVFVLLVSRRFAQGARESVLSFLPVAKLASTKMPSDYLAAVYVHEQPPRVL